MSATIESLAEEVRGLKTLLEAVARVLQPASQSRPLTALELMTRWSVAGHTFDDRLDILARMCRERGLRRMAGTRGANATYMVADVIAAEAYASGKTQRRRRAA